MKNPFSSSLLLMALLALSLTFSACKKDDVNPAGGPSINITGPADNTTYNSGDTLMLRGTITDDDELHEYSIKLVYKSDHKMAHDSTYYYFTEHKHAKSVSIDRDIKLVVTDHSNFELTIKASNHDGQQAEKTIKLHVMP